MRRIMFVTTEMTPFVATGGLGEVSEGLPVALAEKGNDVTVVLPLYRQISREGLYEADAFTVQLSWRNLFCRCFLTMHRGVRCCFLENDYYFNRPCLYGEYDDGERFAFFCAAVMALIPRLEHRPDILHLNDWQTALCLPYLKTYQRNNPYYRGIGTVYTIHNMEYQGIYSDSLMGDVFGLSPEEGGALYEGGRLNLTAGAIRLADRITTVSPTYARELADDRISLGLGSVIRENSYKLRGIVNGIDVSVYDPANGSDGIVPFGAEWVGGKHENKLQLQRELGLPEASDRPIVAMVTRLAGHKGIDLVIEAWHEILSRGCQFVLLGCGEGHYEAFFRHAAEQYRDQVRAITLFDRSLSRRIYAGADLFLMPSRSEACGVAQMIASRYGAIPLVHQTGGLVDTVTPYDATKESGDGFGFGEYSKESLLRVFHMAMDLYYTQNDRFAGLRYRAMIRDRSWWASAEEYEGVYEEAMAGNR